VKFAGAEDILKSASELYPHYLHSLSTAVNARYRLSDNRNLSRAVLRLVKISTLKYFLYSGVNEFPSVFSTFTVRFGLNQE